MNEDEDDYIESGYETRLSAEDFKKFEVNWPSFISGIPSSPYLKVICSAMVPQLQDEIADSNGKKLYIKVNFKGQPVLFKGKTSHGQVAGAVTKQDVPPKVKKAMEEVDKAAEEEMLRDGLKDLLEALRYHKRKPKFPHNLWDCGAYARKVKKNDKLRDKNVSSADSSIAHSMFRCSCRCRVPFPACTGSEQAKARNKKAREEIRLQNRTEW